MKSESQFIILVSCVTLINEKLKRALTERLSSLFTSNRAVLERPSLRSLELQSNHILALIFCGGISSEP